MDDVDYTEGIFVGYRYYDEKGIKPLFPFGHGLSYTTFEYSNLTVSENEIKDDKTLTVMVDVTNTGDRDGMEIVQLYVSDKESSVRRPVRELKGFEKLFLKAGETKKAVFHLDKRSFAYYEPDIHDWFVEYGEFIIEAGSSSRDIRLSTSVYVSSVYKTPSAFHLEHHLWRDKFYPRGKSYVRGHFKQNRLRFWRHGFRRSWRFCKGNDGSNDKRYATENPCYIYKCSRHHKSEDVRNGGKSQRNACRKIINYGQQVRQQQRRKIECDRK